MINKQVVLSSVVGLHLAIQLPREAISYDRRGFAVIDVYANKQGESMKIYDHRECGIQAALDFTGRHNRSYDGFAELFCCEPSRLQVVERKVDDGIIQHINLYPAEPGDMVSELLSVNSFLDVAGKKLVYHEMREDRALWKWDSSHSVTGQHHETVMVSLTNESRRMVVYRNGYLKDILVIGSSVFDLPESHWKRIKNSPAGSNRFRLAPS